MGYDVSVDMGGVVIPADKVSAAIEAMKVLMSQVQEKGGGGTFTPGKPPVRHFAWVNTAAALKHLEERNLVGFFGEWRYAAVLGTPMTPLEQLATGEEFSAVRVDYFSGSKLGDDAQLWAAVAPFLEDSSVEFRGEDDHHWRYVFEGGTMTEQIGTLVWE
jgi:hypothetical protein